MSDRQWGTVREDYSEHGTAWEYFNHDQARSRAYRWGEDGIAGISDDRQRLCFALALWNGVDPILKERYFHGDNGAGIGASHQTGWTGLVATGIALYANADSEKFLAGGALSAASALAGTRTE